MYPIIIYLHDEGGLPFVILSASPSVPLSIITYNASAKEISPKTATDSTSLTGRSHRQFPHASSSRERPSYPFSGNRE
jgi:hypothetical protein